MGGVSSKASNKKAPSHRLSFLSPFSCTRRPASLKRGNERLSFSQRVVVDCEEEEEEEEEEEREECSVSLAPSSYGVLNSDICQGSFLKFCKLGKQFQTLDKVEGVFTVPMGPKRKFPLRACTKVKPAMQETHAMRLLQHEGRKGHDMEVIDRCELTEDLEAGCTTTIPNILTSFDSSQRPTAFVAEVGLPVPKKYYLQGGRMGMPLLSSDSEHPRRRSSHSSLIYMDDSRSVSSYDGISITGLKVLGCPMNSLSFYRSPDMTRPNSRKPSLDYVRGSKRYVRLSKELYRANSPFESPRESSRFNSRKISMEGWYESGRPLFDPALMARFEEALEASMAANYDDWVQYSTNDSITPSVCSADTWASSETAPDTETMPARHRKERKFSASKVMSMDLCDVKNKALLTSYEMRCPPRGEGKVVLYFTSLRGVRKTYEDCCRLRLILRGLGVKVDERDVWMHSKFKEELMDVLGKRAMQVPHLFIKGRYIGGVEVEQLHEDGVLVGLLEDLATGMIHSICEGCGDVRFIPCLCCNGSCKVCSEDYEVLRCNDCNENGLIMCPVCVVA